MSISFLFSCHFISVLLPRGPSGLLDAHTIIKKLNPL